MAGHAFGRQIFAQCAIAGAATRSRRRNGMPEIRGQQTATAARCAASTGSCAHSTLGPLPGSGVTSSDARAAGDLGLPACNSSCRATCFQNSFSASRGRRRRTPARSAFLIEAKILAFSSKFSILDDVVEEQHIGGQRIELVVAQRLRVAERHGAPDVVEHRRRIGPDTSRPVFIRIVRFEGAGAAGEHRPASGALAEFAVAGRRTAPERRLRPASRCPCPAAGPAPSGRTSMSQPAISSGFAACPMPSLRRASAARRTRLLGRSSRRQHTAGADCEHARANSGVKKLRHFQSPRSGARARSGCRCCDRSS